MKFRIVFILSLALHVAGKGTVIDGGVCSTDDECYSYCCNNIIDSSGTQGICVPI